MAKAFSLASWNVEHFKLDPTRVERVVAFLDARRPDVFALYEVEGSEVFETLVTRMPRYSFHITEGPQTQEILVGVKSPITAFFTQKVEFRSGSSYLRPGALLTVTVHGANYPLLFLHTKSGNDPKGLGLRDDMLERAVAFKSVLQSSSPANAVPNYVFLGDLNTMGMRYKYVPGNDIDASEELLKLDRRAARSDMRRLAKTHTATWSNGSTSSIPDSDLDQVVAAEHLRFRKWAGGAEVRLYGWPQETAVAGRDQWIREYSDHALLYMEVQR